MISESAGKEYLARIRTALLAAAEAIKRLAPGSINPRNDGDREASCAVDREVSHVLRKALLGHGEGWLSEEEADDRTRLSQEIVWVVDPIDGTREFLDGAPEWCISIGLTIAGAAVAGGIYNPVTDELFLGALGFGVTYNGRQVQASLRTDLDGALVLASRQEWIRGEWALFHGRGFIIRPTGSVAYKLALVSAGLADATWTLSPKHEWDISAGVALVHSAGGYVGCHPNAKLQFNRREVLLPGLVACGKGIANQVLQTISLVTKSQQEPPSFDRSRR
jgi:myo-inositol-1(or 4)-monophosphatase